MASIATREVTENYNEDAPVRTLVRGTWFWRYGTAPNSKLVALHEETAALAETWYQGIKEDIIRECCLASELSNDGGYVEPTGIGGFSTGPTTGIANSSSNGSRTISRPDLTKPWVLPVGEIMGPGAGQYRLVATRNNIHTSRIQAMYQYSGGGGGATRRISPTGVATTTTTATATTGNGANVSQPVRAGATTGVGAACPCPAHSGLQSLPSDADFVSRQGLRQGHGQGHSSSGGLSSQTSDYSGSSSNSLSIDLGLISPDYSPSPSRYSSAVNSPYTDFHEAHMETVQQDGRSANDGNIARNDNNSSYSLSSGSDMPDYHQQQGLLGMLNHLWTGPASASTSASVSTKTNTKSPEANAPEVPSPAAAVTEPESPFLLLSSLNKLRMQATASGAATDSLPASASPRVSVTNSARSSSGGAQNPPPPHYYPHYDTDDSNSELFVNIVLVRASDIISAISVATYPVVRGYPNPEVASGDKPAEKSWDHKGHGMRFEVEDFVEGGGIISGSGGDVEEDEEEGEHHLKGGEDIPTGHLIFMIHGVGEALWRPNNVVEAPISPFSGGSSPTSSSHATVATSITAATAPVAGADAVGDTHLPTAATAATASASTSASSSVPSEFQKKEIALESFRLTVDKFSALCQECVVEDYTAQKRTLTVLPSWHEERQGQVHADTKTKAVVATSITNDPTVSTSPSASHFPTVTATPLLPIAPSRYRVDCIPIEWHDTLHDQNSALYQRIRSVTNNTVPLMREFGNAAGVDLMAYQTIEYRTRILTAVSARMNKIYQKYCELNPRFTGRCSVIGHSLGSIIAFDIMSVQPPWQGQEQAPHSSSSSSTSTSSMSTSTLEPGSASELGSGGAETISSVCVTSVCAEQQHHTHSAADKASQTAELHRQQLTSTPIPALKFRPKHLFVVGSPIALFFSLRSNGASLAKSYRFPTCSEFYNVFHPFDPVAYRIEPLYDFSYQQSLSPVVLDHHTGSYIHYHFRQLGKELDEGVKRLRDNFLWFHSTVTSTVTSTVSKIAQQAQGVGDTTDAGAPDTTARSRSRSSSSSSSSSLSPFPIDEIPLRPGEFQQHQEQPSSSGGSTGVGVPQPTSHSGGVSSSSGTDTDTDGRDSSDDDDLVHGEGYDQNPAAAALLGLPPLLHTSTTRKNSSKKARKKRSKTSAHLKTHASAHATDAAVIPTYPLPACMLNQQQRIDHTVQESMLENSNTYMAAMTAHSSYFDNKDVAMFIISKIQFE